MSGLGATTEVNQTPRKISVYILTANRLLREALEHTFRIRANIQVAGSGEEFRDLQPIAALRPDVLLVNGSIPELEWERVVCEARQVSPESRLVLFSMREDTELFFRAIRAGVVGYVLSECPASDLVAAVRCVAKGEAVCPPRLCLALFRYVSRQAAIPSPALLAERGLTRREQQLLPLISQGLTNKEIACRLILSEQTIKNHIARILRKMDTHDRLSAAQAAQAFGWNL